MSQEACVLYLVRHGATAASEAHPVLMAGRGTDSPLSTTGQAQARRTGEFLSRWQLDAIYASPMGRAQTTAAAIATAQHPALVPAPVEALIEADLGTWEGLSWADIKARDRAAYDQFVARPDQYGYGGGENITQVRDRAIPALVELAARHAGGRIAVVTHRIVIRACVAHLLGMPLAESRRLSPSTCGISVVHARPDALELATFNATFHLDAK